MLGGEVFLQREWRVGEKEKVLTFLAEMNKDSVALYTQCSVTI